MITIKLVGGPDDGAEVKFAKRPFECLMPRWVTVSVNVHENIVDEAAACFVSVYRQRLSDVARGTDRYDFHGVERY